LDRENYPLWIIGLTIDQARLGWLNDFYGNCYCK
jgi:hypothetical protein